MNVLLDTHILLWAMLDDGKLPAEARRVITRRGNVMFVSAAAIWEVAILNSIGRLDVDTDRLLLRAREAGGQILAITIQHARAVENLPMHHRDPFDRMLIAQAITEPLHLLTSDGRLAQYSKLVIEV